MVVVWSNGGCCGGGALVTSSSSCGGYDCNRKPQFVNTCGLNLNYRDGTMKIWSRQSADGQIFNVPQLLLNIKVVLAL